MANPSDFVVEFRLPCVPKKVLCTNVRARDLATAKMILSHSFPCARPCGGFEGIVMLYGSPFSFGSSWSHE